MARVIVSTLTLAASLPYLTPAHDRAYISIVP
jgi:hypothetical protein